MRSRYVSCSCCKHLARGTPYEPCVISLTNNPLLKPCIAQAHLESTQAELSSLQVAADTASRRLGRAEKLISALSEESVRWKVGRGDTSLIW
jgi:hypothetical protein